mmetsp:Transcript_16977/g.53518  ORF Transcript_16977/g.53518 Transcript_16977/m.53518 type:complete len:242 (+) Transcript_16977:108-833(+)
MKRSMGPGLPLFQPGSCVEGSSFTISLPLTMESSTLRSFDSGPFSSTRRKAYQPRFNCRKMRLHLVRSRNSRSRGSISSLPEAVRVLLGDCARRLEAGRALCTSAAAAAAWTRRTGDCRAAAGPRLTELLRASESMLFAVGRGSSCKSLVADGVITACCWFMMACSARSRAARSNCKSSMSRAISAWAASTSAESFPSRSRDAFSSWLRWAMRSSCTTKERRRASTSLDCPVSPVTARTRT